MSSQRCNDIETLPGWSAISGWTSSPDTSDIFNALTGSRRAHSNVLIVYLVSFDTPREITQLETDLSDVFWRWRWREKILLELENFYKFIETQR